MNQTGLLLKVRLTRKLANTLNGIDLTRVQEGECVELLPSEARLLILEEWAEIVDPAPVETMANTSVTPGDAEPSSEAQEPEHEPY